ncbi:hypothetical protein ACWXVM_00500 [Mycoplasma sp. 2261]
MTKKSKLFLLGTSSALLVPIMTISCATKKEPNKPNNPSNPVNPQDSQKPKKTPQTPSSIELLGFDKEELNKPSIDKSITEEDFNRQIGKQNSQKQTNPSTDDKKPHKPSIKLDENAFKNIAPDIIFDYNEPSNEQIQKIVNNYYNQYLYQKYDPSKEEKGIRFSFSLEGQEYIFNKDINVNKIKVDENKQKHLNSLADEIVFALKNNSKTYLSEKYSKVLISSFEKQKQKQILDTFEEYINKEWQKMNNIYDESLFTSNGVAANGIKNSINNYYKQIDLSKRTIRQLLQDKKDVNNYFRTLNILLFSFADLKEFGEKFPLFQQNKFITKQQIDERKITHGDFGKLIQYRKNAIKKLGEKITYKTWLQNQNDAYYTLSTNLDIHKMHDYNIALTQLWTFIDELKNGANLIKIDKTKLETTMYTEDQVIEMLKKPETKKQTEAAFYAQYKDKHFTNIFDPKEKNTRWDRNKNYILEFKAWVHKYKNQTKPGIFLLTKITFDNKETDEFLIKYTFLHRTGVGHLGFLKMPKTQNKNK